MYTCTQAGRHARIHARTNMYTHTYIRTYTCTLPMIMQTSIKTSQNICVACTFLRYMTFRSIDKTNEPKKNAITTDHHLSLRKQARARYAIKLHYFMLR